MSTRVLTGVSHRWEAGVATVLGQVPDATVVRRCADLADLLATAATGTADVAVISADLRSLDRSDIATLRGQGLRLVGLYAPGDEDQERRLRQWGVTSVVETTADATVLGAALEGAEPAAPELPDDEEIDEEALHQLAAGASASAPETVDDTDGDPGGIVAVWGAHGAPGRTTVATHLAAEIAGLGVGSLLVDADTYGACIAQTLALLDEAPGLAAAARLADRGTLDAPALARLAPEVAPGMRVLTGLPRPDRWPELRESALEHVLEMCRLVEPLTVVDIAGCLEEDEELSYDTRAPRRNLAATTVLRHADDVLAVVAADPVGLQRFVRALPDLQEVAAGSVRVVVNRARSSAVGADPEQRVAEALERFAGVGDLVVLPEDRTPLDEALLAGRTLREQAPRCPLRRALVPLAASLADVPVPRSGRRRLSPWGSESRSA